MADPYWEMQSMLERQRATDQMRENTELLRHQRWLESERRSDRQLRRLEAKARQAEEEREIEALEKLQQTQKSLTEWTVSQRAFRALFHQIGRQNGMDLPTRMRSYNQQVVSLGKDNPAFRATDVYKRALWELKLPDWD